MLLALTVSYILSNIQCSFIILLKSEQILGKSEKQIHTKVWKTHQVAFPLIKGPRQQETATPLKKEVLVWSRETKGRQASLKHAQCTLQLDRNWLDPELHTSQMAVLREMTCPQSFGSVGWESEAHEP